MEQKIYSPRKKIPKRLIENLNRGVSVQLIEVFEKLNLNLIERFFLVISNFKFSKKVDYRRK